jgi:cell division septation protein DedD
MYDTRWPRPGPAMAAVAAVLGLVAGAILGLSSPAGAPTAQASAPPETTIAPTTTTLPDEFHTVILGSFDERAKAEARLRLVREQGVRDAGLLDQERYALGTRWAVYSGVFQTEDEAEAHMEQLAQLGIDERYRYVKPVKRAD